MTPGSCRFDLRVLLLAILAAATGCGDSPTGLDAGLPMELTLAGLPAVDSAGSGSYEVWLYPASGDPVSIARFATPTDLADDGGAGVDFELPVDDPARIAVTLEPPGDDDQAPSPYEVIGGAFRDGEAHLTIEGSVTGGDSLVREPGAHSLFTSSNNHLEGYPSYENSGLWLFNIYPEKNPHETREVHVAPLRRSWLYEGWIVYRHGTPEAVWISYGKYRPDQRGLLTSRDDTGSGPFSGDDDYVNGGVEDVPGDEWTTKSGELDLPGGFELPLVLNAVDPTTGEAVWTHVISIEPAFDESEPLYSGRPFLRPYRNPVGEGGPAVPRFIQYRDNAPTGTARVAAE